MSITSKLSMYMLLLYALAVSLNKPAEAILCSVLMLFYLVDNKHSVNINRYKIYTYAVLSYFLSDALSSLYNYSGSVDLIHIIRLLPVFIGVTIILTVKDRKYIDYSIIMYILATFMIAIVAVYQYLIMDIVRPPTFRNAIQIGYVFNYSIALTFAACLHCKRTYKLWAFSALTLISLALLFGEARGAWFSMACAIGTLILCAPSAHKRKFAISLVVISVTLLFLPQVRSRLNEAQKNVVDYSSSVDKNTSIGLRFDMWKASLRMFREHPLLGVGPGNWQKETLRAEGRGEVSSRVASYNQPHNMYLHAMATKVVLGLGALLILAFTPLYLVWKHKMFGTYYGDSLFLISLMFLLQGLTDTVPSLHDPFSSYILIVGLLLSGSLLPQKSPAHCAAHTGPFDTAPTIQTGI